MERRLKYTDEIYHTAGNKGQAKQGGAKDLNHHLDSEVRNKEKDGDIMIRKH